MITVREIVYALYGAYRLCFFDRGGMAFFNASREGFWRSFYSAILIAPIHGVLVFTDLQRSRTPILASAERIFLIEGSSYLVLVFAYPVVMYYICELLDRRQRYMNYIVAYNWTGVWLALLALPFALLNGADFVPDIAANVASLIVTAVSLVILWGIARTALEISGLVAAGLVAIDLTLGVIIQNIADARLALA